ncbi:MAG TPA: hypothetical protein VF753_12680 [Terriglobales bacterium]
MGFVDPERERQRLASVYAGQSDGELEQVAAQMADLTEIAREALRMELDKRGLHAEQMEESSGAPAHDFRNLLTIRTFWSLAEADLAKGLLEAEGIEAFLFDDNVVRQNVFYANALGGIKLRVDAANAQEADRVLAEQVSEDRVAGDEGSGS